MLVRVFKFCEADNTRRSKKLLGQTEILRNNETEDRSGNKQMKEVRKKGLTKERNEKGRRE